MTAQIKFKCNASNLRMKHTVYSELLSIVKMLFFKCRAMAFSFRNKDPLSYAGVAHEELDNYTIS